MVCLLRSLLRRGSFARWDLPVLPDLRVLPVLPAVRPALRGIPVLPVLPAQMDPRVLLVDRVLLDLPAIRALRALRAPRGLLVQHLVSRALRALPGLLVPLVLPGRSALRGLLVLAVHRVERSVWLSHPRMRRLS